jgi:dTDP-4-dehydrorhamnose 3,5-epimerase
MRVVPTAVEGVVLVEGERVHDERGAFARLYDRDVFEAHGLETDVALTAVSRNRVEGTLRGLHYQLGAAAEAKLVSCISGRMFDVAVDLRLESPTYGGWAATELEADADVSLFIPGGCAHGFLTLEDDSVVHYQISTPHRPEAAAGIRWDDPGLGIDWPATPRVLSERDRTYPDHDWRR